MSGWKVLVTKTIFKNETFGRAHILWDYGSLALESIFVTVNLIFLNWPPDLALFVIYMAFISILFMVHDKIN